MIYFIRQDDDSLVKIGHTEDIKNRLCALQVSNGHKLSVILLINGDFGDESELHLIFKEYKIRGEWYFLSDDIKSYIQSQYHNDLRIGEAVYSETDEPMQTRFIRKSNNRTLKEVGSMLGITAQSVREVETRELMKSATIRSMENYGNALGYKFVYKFIKDAEP